MTLMSTMEMSMSEEDSSLSYHMRALSLTSEPSCQQYLHFSTGLSWCVSYIASVVNTEVTTKIFCDDYRITYFAFEPILSDNELLISAIPCCFDLLFGTSGTKWEVGLLLFLTLAGNSPGPKLGHNDKRQCRGCFL